MSPADNRPLDAAVEDAIRALRHYVEVGRGVRAEFEPEQADLDPRVEQAAIDLGLVLGRLEDAFTDELGFMPTIEPTWDDDELVTSADGAAASRGLPGPVTADTFSLGLVVSTDLPGELDGPDPLDGVVGLLDEAAASLVDRLGDNGFLVTEYFVARGEHRPHDASGEAEDA